MWTEDATIARPPAFRQFRQPCPCPCPSPPPSRESPLDREGPSPTVGERVLTAALNGVDHGIVVLDARQTFRYANAAGRLHLAEGAVLRLFEGRVLPREPAALAGFRQAVVDAGRGQRTLLLMRAAGSVVSLAVAPMGDVDDERPVAMLLIGDSARPGLELSTELFARTHGLTYTERLVLRRLYEGLGPAEIAAAGGVAISTVRTQISAIREKTGTASIRELLRLVARLPPMAAPVLEGVM